MSQFKGTHNCVACHGIGDLVKWGFSWNERLKHDVHNLHGLECVQCHPGNPEHNFAKGDENMSTVRDDLDNTMLTCRQCHMQGFMGAPRPDHTGYGPTTLINWGVRCVIFLPCSGRRPRASVYRRARF